MRDERKPMYPSMEGDLPTWNAFPVEGERVDHTRKRTKGGREGVGERET